MRKIIIAMVCILAVACSKEPAVERGIYSAKTDNGTLYLELGSNGKCYGHFSGFDENKGSYYISGDVIHVSCYVDYETMSSSRYRVYLVRGDGEIFNSTSFSVPCEELMRHNKTTLYFNKR